MTAPAVFNDPRLAGFDSTKPIVKNPSFGGYDPTDDNTAITYLNTHPVDWSAVSDADLNTVLHTSGKALDGSEVGPLLGIGGIKSRIITGDTLTPAEIAVAHLLTDLRGFTLAGGGQVLVAPTGNPNVPATLAGNVAYFNPGAQFKFTVDDAVLHTGGWKSVDQAKSEGLLVSLPSDPTPLITVTPVVANTTPAVVPVVAPVAPVVQPTVIVVPVPTPAPVAPSVTPSPLSVTTASKVATIEAQLKADAVKVEATAQGLFQKLALVPTKDWLIGAGIVAILLVLKHCI